MTDLQKQFYDKVKQLDKEEEIFNEHHRRAKKKKQLVIVPLQREVDRLCKEVHAERLKKIESKS